MIRLSITAILIVVLTGCFFKGERKPFGEDQSLLTPSMTIDEIKEKAIQVADSAMVVWGYDLEIMVREATVQPTRIGIYYKLKDDNVLGGDATLHISRKTLQVIGVWLGQ